MNKCKIESVNIISDFLEKASVHLKEKAHFLLHCFDVSNITLDECFNVISSLHNVPICTKLGVKTEKV